MMLKVRETKETNELQILRCRLSKKEAAKEHGALDRVRVSTKKYTKVATVAKMERRTLGRRAVARKEAKGRREVAVQKPEHVGRVARQDTLQRGVEKVATTISTPLMKMTVKTLKKQLTRRRICKHGVC